MALIKCPDCKSPVSSSAEICLKCGSPIAKLMNEIPTSVTCSECNNNYSFDSDNCPSCGLFNGTKSSHFLKFEKVKELSNFEAHNISIDISRLEDEKKSGVASILLAFFFGPFGSFYCGMGVGFIMCVAYFFSMFGFPIAPLVVTLVNMVVCYLCVQEHNNKIVGRQNTLKLNLNQSNVQNLAS